MAGEPEQLLTCAACGATIYPEHLQRRVAERWEGQLLCPFCLRDKKSASALGAAVSEDMPVVDLPRTPAADEPIAYEKKPTVIRSGGGGLMVGEVAAGTYRRALLAGSPNATRCKTFHCKLADGPIAYMCEQINEWADADDSIEIKFATSTIGVVEGKHVDPHLIVTVFY